MVERRGQRQQCGSRSTERAGVLAGALAIAAVACARRDVGVGAHVVAQGDFTCVLAGGSVRCCGNGWDGELGNGEHEDEGHLVDVAGVNDAISLSAGAFHACAVRKDGAVWCWGENRWNQLGYSSSDDANLKPHPTGPLGGPATQVSAGALHTCARLRDGTARCWGVNSYGQLGTGKASEAPATAPVAVVGLGGIAEIAAGGFYTCARLEDGTVRCWGANESGQLGDGTTQDRLSPVQVEGVTHAVELAAGMAFTCARLAGGEVACWGNDRKGSKASRVAGVEGAVQVVVTGYGWACARLLTGKGLCWGPGRAPSADRLPAAEGALMDLALGSGHTCVIDAHGTLRCQGQNLHGQLCDGSSPPRSSTFPPPG